MATTYTSLTAAAVLGVSTQIYLSPIPEVSTIKFLLAYTSSNLLLLFYLLLRTSSLLPSLQTTTLLNTVFILSLFLSTLISRLYTSPLARLHLPGPKIAAISKLWAANQFRKGRHSLTVKGLHKEYDSDFVRIGPNEVSVRHVDAIEKVYRGRYRRGTFYEVGAVNGEFNLNTTRDNEVHQVWRRIWEKAFHSNEFKHYNPRVEMHVSKLVEVLKKAGGKEINCSKAIDNLIFDIMADMAFAKNAGLQDGVGDNSYMDFIHKYLGIVGVAGSLRNLCQLLFYLPHSEDLKEFRRKGDNMLEERQVLGSSRKDLFRHLLAEDSETKCKFTQAELNSNANLVIVAGSDTSSSPLSQTLGVLAKDKRILRKLQKEIDAIEEELTVQSTMNLPYLNAVVNEALRLLNPIPSGVQATLSPQGAEIAGVHLPGNIQVQIPHIILMTDERYFPQGEEFIPERWTERREELLLDRRAFIPFGYGVHSCVGKQLALNEMRLVLAKVVKEFNIEKGESYDEVKFAEEWVDFAVVRIGALWLKFVERT